MARISKKFGGLVSKILDERGLSLRAATYKTGISFTVIGNMRNNLIPTRDIVNRFADGLGVDPYPLMVAAGYEEPDVDTQLEDVLKRVQCSGGDGPLAKEDVIRIVKEKLQEIYRKE